MHKHAALAGVVLLLAVGGCDSGGSSDSNAVEIAPPPAPALDVLATIFTADPEGDTVAIADVDQLTAALEATFGDADALPWGVEEDDAIGDVRDRALAR